MRHTLKGPLAYATGLLLTFVLAASVTAAPVGVGGKRSVDTMNINLYVGSDIGRVLALDPNDPLCLQKLVGTVAEVFDTVVTSQPEIQMGQAIELIEGPANVRMPVILSGDFNADVLHRNGVETYDAFVAADFDDAWAELHKGNPAGGLTWGHDEFLADPSVPMTWRLDVVWYRGCGLLPRESTVLDLVLNRTEAPLWASDHAAVTANFKVGGLRPAMSPRRWTKFCSRIGR